MNRTQQALIVVDQLNAFGIKCVLCGGAARDVLHNVEPKDFDLLMLDDMDIDQVTSELDALDFAIHVTPFGPGTSMLACEDAKLDWVLKFKVESPSGTLEFDLIQNAAHPTTPREAVALFDCNLNMAWLDFDGENPLACGIEDYPLWNGGVVRLAPLCDFPAARVAYLQPKYPQYTWPTPAEIEAHRNYLKET